MVKSFADSLEQPRVQIHRLEMISLLESTGIKEPCNARTVNELLLQEITLKTINQTFGDKEHFIQVLQQNMAKAVRQFDTTSVECIDEKLQELQH